MYNVIEISPTKYVYTKIIGADNPEDNFLINLMFICTNKEKTISVEWTVGNDKIYIFEKYDFSDKIITLNHKPHPILNFVKAKTLDEFTTSKPNLILMKNNRSFEEIFEYLQTYIKKD